MKRGLMIAVVNCSLLLIAMSVGCAGKRGCADGSCSGGACSSGSCGPPAAGAPHWDTPVSAYSSPVDPGIAPDLHYTFPSAQQAPANQGSSSR